MSFKGRLRENIYLIRLHSDQFVSNKLPLNKQVLRILFYYLCKVKLDLHHRVTSIIKKTQIFSGKARLPIREQKYCIKKLEDLH